MKAYYIICYDIDDMETFQQYPPKAAALIYEYGGEVLVSDTSTSAIEGHAKQMNAIVAFPTKEAALGCYHDDRYREVMKIRHSSTSNCTMVLASEFVPE
ncbi:MAG: DUF1330 domain-containing protein [Chryseolinea sp.]